MNENTNSKHSLNEEPEIKKQKLDNLENEIVDDDDNDDSKPTLSSNQQPQSLEHLKGKLRYFTPEELLNLFGFNDVNENNTRKISFPNEEKLTLRKKYELIGNSLNVIVANKLIDFMLSSSLSTSSNSSNS